MKFTIELDTDNSLLDNLNTIEDTLRTQGIMTHTDNLVAITDNPLHDDSITLRDDVVISAVGNQISVMPTADVSVSTSVYRSNAEAVNDSNPDYEDTDAIEDVFSSLLDDDDVDVQD